MNKGSISKSAATSENGKRNEEIEWEMTPSGMLVQKRESGGDPDDRNGGGASRGPMITLIVSYSSSTHEVFVPSNSTFGDLKRVLVSKTGLEPPEQKLFFRGKEKEDDEPLQMAGVKDKSKVLLLEHPESKQKKLEEAKKKDEISKACQAVAGIRTEVDKLSERVAAMEVAVNGGFKVSDKEFVVSSELLMRELLKLDGIEAEGEARQQRKAEVRRVQNIVEVLDSLKEKNSNPFNKSGNAVCVTTKWETFDSGMGSLSPPPSTPSSAKVTQDWERFD